MAKSIDRISADKFRLNLARATVDMDAAGAKVNIWGGESSIGLSLPRGGRVVPKLHGNIIVYPSPDMDVKLYADEPRLEYEIVLKAHPGVSELVLPFDMTNLQAHYQGELDAQAKVEGHIRDPSMVGGYALYHSTRMAFTRNGVGGQAGLLRVPEAIRADGKRLWLPPTLHDNKLILPLDPSFFSGPYPIVIDPTLGLDTEGGTADTSCENRIKGSWAETDGDGGLVTTLYAWIKTTTAAKKHKVAVYSYAADDDATLLRDYNTEQSVNPNGQAEYSSAAVVGYTLAASTKYFLLILGEGDGGSHYFYYNSVANVGVYMTRTYADGWPADLTGLMSGVGRQYSAWCDVGAAPSANVPAAMRAYRNLREN